MLEMFSVVGNRQHRVVLTENETTLFRAKYIIKKESTM